MQYFVADFETTSFKQYQIDGFTRVFAWGIADVEQETIVNRGLTIESFMDYIYTLKERYSTIYFHNLKFDGSFILSYLLANGYTRVSAFSNNPENEVRTLIGEMGEFYRFTLRYYRGKTKYTVHIEDSSKKISLSVEVIAKAYNLPIRKGDFDYDMYRPVGYELTADEWYYVDRDCLIIAMAMKIKLHEGLTKITKSSDAYNSFKEHYTKKQFDYMFPQLQLDILEDIRKAYKGGWVFFKPEYASKLLDNVLSFDVNGLYTYAMQQLLPYGVPITYWGRYKADEKYPLFIQCIEVAFKLKDGYLPTLQNSSLGRFSNNNFLTDTEGDIIELWLTNYDLDLFLKHHKIEFIDYKMGYKFRASNRMFLPYFDKWQNVKEQSEGGKRAMAKDMLNTLYGKFGTKLERKDKTPYLDEDLVLRFNTNPATMSGQRYYLPVAVFTTAQARQVEIVNAQKLYKHFVYGDTDSLKLVGITAEEVRKILHVDAKKTGAFKYEARYREFKCLKAKHYAYYLADEFIKEESDHLLHIVASGLPDKVKATIDDINIFEIGFSTTAKLIGRQVRGGIVLIPSLHQIK